MIKNEIVNLTKKLINIESTKDSKSNLDKTLAIAQKELKDYHLKVFKKNNIVSHLYSNVKKSKIYKIILNAHLDVVSGSKDQFKTKITDDKLIGRGAYDMKASAAVEILVFKNLAKKLNYPIALQLVTDEEIGGLNGTKYQIEKGIKSEFVIAGESTNFEINNEAKGIYWLKLDIHGKSAHAARPWEGINAIYEMCKFVEKINKVLPVPTTPKWTTTQNLAKIETSNNAYNKVPDVCTAIFDIRYIPSDKNKVLEKIKKIIPKNSEYEFLINEPSQYTNETNSYIKRLKHSVEKITKKRGKLVSYHGASDVRHYDRIKVSGVCFGPIGAGLHTDNEWVSIKSLLDYYKILEDFLIRL